VLYGHSLGGLIALGYVLSPVPRGPGDLPDLLVLSAPALDDDQPAWQRPLAGIFVRVIPRARIATGLPKGGRSRDPEVEAKVASDPLCSSSSTVRWGAEAFAEQDRLRALLADLAAMPVPTYVVHGSADPIVPPRASARLEGKGNVTLRVHEGLRHETHHEPEHEQVLAEVVAWILASRPVASGV
jgi:alpha-beta hydrolase superfamily lysophospholipase